MIRNQGTCIARHAARFTLAVLLKRKDARLAATTLTTTHTRVVVKHTTNRILKISKISIQAFKACFNDDVNDFFHVLIGL